MFRSRMALSLLGVLLTISAVAQTVHRVGPESVGLVTVIPMTKLYDNAVQNQSIWEPYTGAFVDGTLAAVTNTEADGDFTGFPRERGVAFWFNDSTIQEVPGFFTDSGDPWAANNDIIRTNGNPPRIAPEVRMGQTEMVYMFGNECTPCPAPAAIQLHGIRESELVVRGVVRPAGAKPSALPEIGRPRQPSGVSS